MLLQSSPLTPLRNSARELYRCGACRMRELGPAASRWQKSTQRARTILEVDGTVATPALAAPLSDRPSSGGLLSAASPPAHSLSFLPRFELVAPPATTGKYRAARFDARPLLRQIRARAEVRRPPRVSGASCERAAGNSTSSMSGSAWKL